ncbi:MAG: PspA/IM30 family protein [Chloroflexota bacterium]
MAPTLMDKVSTLVNANLHSIVDKALQQNSVAVMDEYIRQAENNLKDLEDSAATLGGSVKTLKRKSDEFSAAAEKLDHSIDTLVLQGKNDLAAAAQAQLNTTQQEAQDYFAQWQQQDSQYQNMLKMRLQLEGRLTSIRQQREQLRSLIELTEAKKVATKTVKSLDSLSMVGDKEISSLADQVKARLDEEDARLELATHHVASDIDDAVRDGEVDRQLEERRKRLLGGSGNQ